MRDSLIHNGTAWVAQVDLGIDPQGKRRRRKKHFRGPDTAEGERQARQAMLAWIAELSPNHAANASTITVDELLDRWVAGNEDRWSAAHAANTRRSVRTIVERVGTVPIRSIRQSDIRDLYAGLRSDGGKDGGPIGERTLGLIHAALSAAFNAALRWELIDRSPMVGVSKPRQQSREVNPPSAAQIAAADAAITDPRWSCLFRLAVATGARRGEIAGLRWSDFRGDQLMIERAVSLTGEIKPPKGGKARLITVDASTLSRASRWRAVCEAVAEQIGAPYDPGGFLFPADLEDPARPMRLDAITHWWMRHRDSVPELAPAQGAAAVRFHDLRHFHATHLLMAGEDLWKVSGRLGHADLSITARVYAHYIPGQDRSAAAIFDQL